MKRCLISGSFDPITIGHIDIIKKALDMGYSVIVGVFNNEEKAHFFDLQTRVKLCKIAIQGLENVQVIGSNGMVSDFCISNNIDVIIRGFRNNMDYAFETEMAVYNYKHCGINTHFIASSSEYLNISSTKVRDIIKKKKKNESDNDFTNIKNFLTDDVTEEIRRIKYE